MKKNATLGYRISLGFGVLIAILLVVGLIGIINMRSASSDASRLSSVYVPEVNLANDVMQNFNNARYNMLGFVSIDDEAALAKAKTNFADLQANLIKVEELGKKYNLKKLLEHEKVAAKALTEYIGTAEQNEKLLARKKTFDESTVTNAALFLKSIEAYRTAQEELFFKEMNDRVSANDLKQRYAKLEKIDDILSVATYARVYGQRAQVKL